MATSQHTYGPTCHLTRSVTFSGSKEDTDVPDLRAQFFYASPLPIDDPLTAIPIPTSETQSTKHPPIPFSAFDNKSLEEAWLALGSAKNRKQHHNRRNSALKPVSESQRKRRASLVSTVADKHVKKHANEPLVCQNCGRPRDACPDDCKCSIQPSCKSCVQAAMGTAESVKNTEQERQALQGPGQASSSAGCDDGDHALRPVDDKIHPCCQELEKDIKTEHRKSVAGLLGGRLSPDDHDKLIQDVMVEAKKQKLGGFSKSRAPPESSTKPLAVVDLRPEADKPSIHGSAVHVASPVAGSSPASGSFVLPVNPDTGTTGQPFQRAPSRSSSPAPSVPSQKSRARPGSTAPQESSLSIVSVNNGAGASEMVTPKGPQDSDHAEKVLLHNCKAHKNKHEDAEIPVGVSRLHLVKLPSLQMRPIYWSPVHDIAAVSRGTWFYRETMYPIEPAVANQLELGYRELRPWSQTWNDELNSALDVGAAGEEKISHRLWPVQSDRPPSSGKNAKKPKPEISALTGLDPWCAAGCFQGEVAARGTVDPDKPDDKTPASNELFKRFPNAQVIYKDALNAFILKPNLQASAYYGRKPLAKIKKGTTVGIHVVRGFDWRAWEKAHPSKKTTTTAKGEQAAAATGNAESGVRSTCRACQQQEERPKVSDLVLVIHGIGQKLSERIESFHFTHAINSFRRSVNVELGNDSVRRVLRDSGGGIMVLPVNWRSNLSFEDGGPMKGGDKTKASASFTLKDITPDSIPAVRGMISDILLDIPFYMSHHKPKMIEALIAEANRVYRLWCRNNPEFQREGRVHIIGHSLGSAMAMDVLSKQPTVVKPVDLHKAKPQTKHFDFDTKNLFLVGSPAAFFLLLERGRLVPRKGRNKPGINLVEDSKGAVEDIGNLGCLAVDNIYNVMQPNDPVAYALNGTVDALYASTLKKAHVPSASAGWFGAIGNAVRSITPGAAPVVELPIGQMPKPPTARLPSQLEMEVHDFSREEIAEKKFYLLNDNGQIDYLLSSGGGPLEIQYINMLGAHSSYWGHPDFVRMLVTEIGRKPGKMNTLPNMRATKRGVKHGAK